MNVVRIRVEREGDRLLGWVGHAGHFYGASISVPSPGSGGQLELGQRLTEALDELGRSIVELVAGVTGELPNFIPHEKVKS